MTATEHMNRSQLLAAYKKAGKNFMTPRKLAKRVLTRINTVVNAGGWRLNEPPKRKG